MHPQSPYADTLLPSRRLLRYVPILGLLALVIALALVGIIQATTTIRASIQHGRVFAVGQPIATNFGSLTVAHVIKLDGLTAQDLAGVTHGIQNLVLANRAQIQVSLQLVNRSGNAVTYAPEQFQLFIAGEELGVGPASGTLQRVQLPAHATLNAELDFVTPRTNRPLWVEYRAVGSALPVRINIGPADPNAGEFPVDLQEEHTSSN